MKGIYLAAYKDRHSDYDLDYNDVSPIVKPDILADMMDVDLSPYDFVLASPPCNFWSRANYRRENSSYALETKHLLPDILVKLGKQSRPFIVENVHNIPLMSKHNIFDICARYDITWYCYERHTYFTNTDFFPLFLPSTSLKIAEVCRQKREGSGVHIVFDAFLKHIHNKE